MKRPRIPAWRGCSWAALSPFGAAALKIAVCALSLKAYLPQYLRLVYIADGLTRANLAYEVAHQPFNLFPRHQWPPLLLWLWGAVLKVWPDIYWSGTVLSIVFDAGTTLFVFLIARRLAGELRAWLAALLFILSPVHHNLTLGLGMSEPFFFCCTAAGVYYAARFARGERGAAAAAVFLALASLFRYEGILLFGGFIFYRLFIKRPSSAIGWLAPTLAGAAVALIILPKVFPVAGKGLWPSLEGVKADGEYVLPHSTAARRFFYLFQRLWQDGRLVAVTGLAGCGCVWLNRYRTPFNVAAAVGLIITFAAVGGVIVIHGTGFCPERHMAIALLLLIPFASLAVRAAWDATSGRAAKAALLAAFVAAAAYQAPFYRIIRDYGYGYAGPCFTCPVLDAEIGLKLRELWRAGELGHQEWVYMERTESSWTNIGIKAFSDHPLHFYLAEEDEALADLPRMPAVMRRNQVRVVILVNERTRAAAKPYYAAYKDHYIVINELPDHTVLVSARGWRYKTPAFESHFIPERSRVLGMR